MFDMLFDDYSLDPEAEWEAMEDLLDNVHIPDELSDLDGLWPFPAPETPQAPGADTQLTFFDLTSSPLVSGFAQDLADSISSWFRIVDVNSSALMDPFALVNDGSYDSERRCLVMGDVAQDLAYLDGQTGPTCSLMAQEQFVERYINRDIPEAVLEWRAESWGYYEPAGLGSGTNWIGQAAILEHFDIPYSRDCWASLNELDASLKAGNDIIIGVDARAFYEDPTLPLGTGHAVTVIGWGVDPSTMQTIGYYVADSNLPGAALFLSPTQLENCWFRDMISVAPITR